MAEQEKKEKKSMAKGKEIKRNIYFERGNSPEDTAILAEISIYMEGLITVYMVGIWIAETNTYEYSLHEDSVFDAYERYRTASDINKIERFSDELDDILQNDIAEVFEKDTFSYYCHELKLMIQAEMREHGLEHYINEEE